MGFEQRKAADQSMITHLHFEKMRPDISALPIASPEVLPGFERLLVDISGRLINLPADQIVKGIEDALRGFCRHLGLDTSTLWLLTAEAPRRFTLAYHNSPDGGPQAPGPTYGDEYFPWITRQVEAGRTVAVPSPHALPAEAARDRERLLALGIRSTISIPISRGGGFPLGAVCFSTTQKETDWPESLQCRLQMVAHIFTSALVRKQSETALREMELQLQDKLQEIERLTEGLESENPCLREENRDHSGNGEIITDDPQMRKILEKAGMVAGTKSTVLILGETGTGKELLARSIHNMSSRKDRAIVTVNCASLPCALMESELFGREKGAYTGALSRMAGRFEIADGSTLFLDEIGELPLELQSKLLRVLEYGIFERLGSSRSIKVDVRIIAATNRDLSQDIAEGKFRKDLFYRLNIFPITIPPLRERKGDIPFLTWAFLKQFEKTMGVHIERIPRKSIEALKAYHWPGNIRELKNIIERAVIMCTSSTLEIHPPSIDAKGQAGSFSTLEDMERAYITEVLEETNWRISGKESAAEILGLKRTTLNSKMKALGIIRDKTT